MLERARSKLTYANVMATIAVFLALGGGAYALKLGKNSVGSKQLRDGQVKLADLATSLRLKCPGGTLYQEGACIETARRSSANWDAASGACESAGGRLPSVSELEGFRREPGITLGTEIQDYEWTGNWYADQGVGQAALIVSEEGASENADKGDLHRFRCARPPKR